MSVYDPALWDAKTPANVLGGKSRAIKARRDRFGRFMPNDEVGQELWTLPDNHGSAGGLRTLEKYGREHFKALAKLRKH